ncbi:hypothetical protein PVL29_011904 [Vitis rotundifolia]|uniref:Uncharacterized protein n=1 Tax=Vitis rotundifolia TaxID=103349 RepID=A0AA38ZPW6_VITRO|nr:hypothetical protein PVL29_011904 [Vitis rotundifolia]
MPKVMLVVSADMRNIALLQPRASNDDTTINYFFQIKILSIVECEQCGWVSVKEVCVSLGVEEKRTTGSKRRNYNNAFLRVVDGCDRRGVISLISGHGNPLSKHHYRKVGLMLFNCDGLIFVTYSFNGGWLAVMIHVDLVAQEYRNVIDGEEVTITNLEAKFVPKG